MPKNASIREIICVFAPEGESLDTLIIRVFLDFLDRSLKSMRTPGSQEQSGV